MIEQNMQVSLRADTDNSLQAHWGRNALMPGPRRTRRTQDTENPATCWKRRGCFCALDRIRTYDLLLRRQTLYPLSYEGIQGSCRCGRDVLELSRKLASNGKPWKTVAHL